ncbi:MAG: hypothetical protein K2Y12_00060 [Chitinophagaceae bacterium]|nr:hypothetical protein [Chitinophagaceae bacterium]
MRLIRFALISAVILFALATAIGLLLPSRVIVSRAVDIAAAPEKVRQFTHGIDRWKTWVAGMGDTSVHVFNAADAQIGNNRVTMQLQNDTTYVTLWTGRSGSPQTSTMRIIPLGSITTVQWQFEQHIGWMPWERLGSMMNDKILGVMMEQNLSTLKSVTEQ